MLGLIVLLQTLLLAVTGPPTSPEYLPLRVADAEGYFKREGLTVVLRTTRPRSARPRPWPGPGGSRGDLARGHPVARAAAACQMSKLVLGLTAAPPVALLTTGTSRHADLRQEPGRSQDRRRDAGAPEHAWLNAILARAGVPLMWGGPSAWVTRGS